MSSAPALVAPDATYASEVTHGRYRLEGILGEGGMAIVHEAVDLVRGRRVALKRLRCDVAHKREAFTTLFEQEFLALAQLAHPRIVTAYDYGVDEQGPYYTMELLDGGDLRRIAPADYRTACALARDVCSALSLVHSRRMVFRDLSPSNVRRTSDGLGKLIDFGGLAAMGPNKDMVGTLPCVPPEALHHQALDARTDLYALGATLYFTLVRRHAYPGRDADELLRLWQQKPRPPSDFVPGIPPALDQLVLDLLQLDPAHRPNSAAEVMERLSAIAQLPHDESLLVEQAYLATPALVAREAQVLLIREHAALVKQGKGASLLVAGPSGVGRSRLLDTSALEAKLAGMLVLQADKDDTAQGDYGAVRDLVSSLLRQAPKLALRHAEPHIALLGTVLPELLAARSDRVLETFNDPQQVNRLVQGALREWLCAIAREQPLLLAVDDVDRIDPPSSAFVALLAREVNQHAILLVSTKTDGEALAKHQAVQGALQILARASTAVQLEPLRIEQTERLLGSLFGEVPFLALTAQHVQRLTDGVPRDIMQLARHLVSEGIVHYQAGAWSLPQRLSATDLPANMADALALRVQRLGPDARALAYVLAAEPALSFSLEECAQLVSLTHARLARALDEVVAAELAIKSAQLCRAAHSAVSAPLTAALDEPTRQLLHVRLAALCEQRAELLRAAQHLLRAGQDERGLDLLVIHAIDSQALTTQSTHALQLLLRSLPEGWLQTYEQCLVVWEQARRPLHEKRALLTRLAGLLAHAGGGEVDGIRHLHALLAGLSRDAGLDLWNALPESLDPVTRVRTAIGQAAVRTKAAAEAERGIDPTSAIKELVNTTVAALGVIAFTNSQSAIRSLPSLAPLSAVSPAVLLIHELTLAVAMRIGGRSEAALAVYHRLHARLAAPDRSGLDPSYHLHTQVRIGSAVGILEAAMGRSSSLEWAAKIAESARIAQAPRYESLSLAIHQLYQLFQGNGREARRIEQQIELLRLESNASHGSEAHFEFNELFAHALANDLTGVKRSVAALSSRSKLHLPFRAAWLYGRGEHQHIRGDHAAALVELEAALALMEPGDHLLWIPAAAAHVRTLLELGQIERACALGAAYLERGEQLGYLRNHLRVALSVALGRRGDHAQAIALAELAIEELTSQGVTGLSLAVAYEVRAQLAAHVGDQASFRHYAALYAGLWPVGGRAIRGAARHDNSNDLDAEDLEQEELDALSQLKSTMESCHTFLERALVGLEFIGRRAGALGGVLFTRTPQGLVRAASFGEAGKDLALDSWATEFFKREVTEHVTEELEASLPSAAGVGPPQSEVAPPFTPVLLAHDDAQGYAFTGLAVFIGQEPSAKASSSRLASELSRSVGQLDAVSPEYL